MCTNCSTPLQMYNTSFSSNISTPQELDETSYHSIVPQSVPELLQNKKKGIPKRVYVFLILFGFLSCFSLLVYITIRVSISMHLSGEVKSNIQIPVLGNFNVSLQAEEARNISSQLDSNIQKVTSEMPSQMWEQIYFDDMLS